MNLSEFGTFYNLVVGLAGIVAGGTTVYFVIKKQLIQLLEAEVEAYKDKVDRLERELLDKEAKVVNCRTAYEDLKFKKDYLKQIIITALTQKQDMTAQLVKEMTTTLKKK